MRLICIVVCSLLLPMTAQANDLLRIYDQALDNDAQLQASGHQRDAAIEVRPIARAALLPQIAASGTDTRERDKITTQVTSPVIDPVTGRPTGATTTTPETFSSISSPYSYGLTLNQSLFNWQYIETLRQAGDQAAFAETTYRSAAQNLTLRVAQAYFGVLSASDNLRSSQAENKALEQQLEQAKRRFDVGLSAITDVQDAQARFDLTVATIIGAQQALDAAKESLALITGGPLDHVAPLQEDIPLPAPDPADVNAWVAAARENNFDLLLARLNTEIADKGIEVARSGHYPSLGLSGAKTRGEQAGFNSGKFDQSRVGVTLSVPIFSGGLTQANVRAATATHEQRRSEYELARRTVEKAARDAYQGVLAGAARVKALKQAVVSNTTSVEASNTGLEVGTRTAVDVLNAQQLLYSAQRDYYKSRYDYLVAVLSLKSAAGRLSAADLAEIDKLLVGG